MKNPAVENTPAPGRRAVVKGLAAGAAGAAGLPLAAVLADPLLARAQAASLATVTIKTPGGRTVSGALGLPAQTPAPAVILIHEWWGLNDQIKAVAADLAAEGYVTLAVDLYDGKVATDPQTARSLTQSVDAAQGAETLTAWNKHLRARKDTTARLGAVGWCFGGGWSLNAAVAAPVEACVVYYGRVTRKAADLADLKGPVQGHFATQDKFITAEMVAGFESEMQAAGKVYETHWYEADHAFANPTSARYDKSDAAQAWLRTLGFLAQNLRA